MPKKYIALFCISVLSAYILGFMSAQVLRKPELTERFYADIYGIDRDYDYLYVEGIPENAISRRGKFDIHIGEEDTVLNKYGDTISIEDLEVGNSVEIKFSGRVLETSPAEIDGTVLIQVIE